jgi:hypothetical protein
MRTLPSVVPLSPTLEVDANVAWRTLGDDIPSDARWGIPVRIIRLWITDALRDGDYQTASVFSALITRTVPAEPPVIVCDRAIFGRTLPVHKVDPVTRERMRLARQSFDRGLAGDFRPSWKGGPRRLLPLV